MALWDDVNGKTGIDERFMDLSTPPRKECGDDGCSGPVPEDRGQK
jgi:hypothetical protein